jgi:hypothetical protein
VGNPANHIRGETLFKDAPIPAVRMDQGQRYRSCIVMSSNNPDMVRLALEPENENVIWM